MDEHIILESILREDVIPRYRRLLDATRDVVGRPVGGRVAFGRLWSTCHGLAHWTRVGCLALRIVRALPTDGRPVERDEEAVLVASFFHDAGRLTEWHEPGHGEAGARILEALAGDLGLDPSIVLIAAQAIRLHDSDDCPLPPADRVGIALANADRLDRVRLGESPRSDLMYDDGVWPSLVKPSEWLLRFVEGHRFWQGLRTERQDASTDA